MYRILYVLYNEYQLDRRITLQNIQTSLKSMDKAGYLIPALTYLRLNGYVNGSNQSLGLTGRGLETTVSLFRKFFIYLKKHKNDELSTWINSLELNKRSSKEFIRDAYFYIQKQTAVGVAFVNYLDEVGSIKNVLDFEIHEHDLGSIIDEIYIDMTTVDRLFQRRFQKRLFCPPLDAQSIMHNAIKGREIDLIGLSAAIGLVLDGICESEIKTLLGTRKVNKGSINKLEALLKKEGISFEPETLSKLRTLHGVRSTISPIHNAGPQIIEHLQQLNIHYPIDSYREAALIMLQSLKDCIQEMKQWFRL